MTSSTNTNNPDDGTSLTQPLPDLPWIDPADPDTHRIWRELHDVTPNPDADPTTDPTCGDCGWQPSTMDTFAELGEDFEETVGMMFDHLTETALPDLVHEPHETDFEIGFNLGAHRDDGHKVTTFWESRHLPRNTDGDGPVGLLDIALTARDAMGRARTGSH